MVFANFWSWYRPESRRIHLDLLRSNLRLFLTFSLLSSIWDTSIFFRWDDMLAVDSQVLAIIIKHIHALVNFVLLRNIWPKFLRALLIEIWIKFLEIILKLSVNILKFFLVVAVVICYFGNKFRIFFLSYLL